MEKIIPVATIAVAAAAAIILALAFFAPLQAPRCTDATGPIVSKTIQLEQFTKIVVSGKIELYLKQDSQESVSIEAQESIADLVSAEAQNGTLAVSLSNPGLAGTGKPCIGEQTKIKVFVSAANIGSVKAGDSAKVFTEGRIYPEQFFLEASDSALIDANISVDDLNSLASSFGTIILSGLAERHSARAITGGKIIADGLETLQGFFEATDNGSIDAMVFGEVSAIAKTGGSVGFGGGAVITNRVAESGGTVTDTSGSGATSDSGGGPQDGTGTGGGSNEEPADGGSGDGNLPGGGVPPAGDVPTGPVCGNAMVEAPEKCELDIDCAIDEECSSCECVKLPAAPGAETMSPETCTTQGGNIACAENPVCPSDVKNAGNVESGGLPCICCVDN